MSPDLSVRIKCIAIDVLVGVIAFITLCVTPHPSAVTLLQLSFLFLIFLGAEMIFYIIKRPY